MYKKFYADIGEATKFHLRIPSEVVVFFFLKKIESTGRIGSQVAQCSFTDGVVIETGKDGTHTIGVEVKEKPGVVNVRYHDKGRVRVFEGLGVIRVKSLKDIEMVFDPQ